MVPMFWMKRSLAGSFGCLVKLLEVLLAINDIAFFAMPSEERPSWLQLLAPGAHLGVRVNFSLS